MKRLVKTFLFLGIFIIKFDIYVNLFLLKDTGFVEYGGNKGITRRIDPNVIPLLVTII